MSAAARLLAALMLAASVSQADALELRARQLAPHSYYVQGESGPAQPDNQGFNSNAGFVITDEGVVVFDALGTPALGRALLAEIRRHTTAPIRYVILSHYHADHAYGADELRGDGTEVWAHEDAVHYLRSELAQRRLAERKHNLSAWVGTEFRLPVPDRLLEGDTAFALGGVQFELRHVGPAHAPEDLAMLVMPDGVFFVGDLIYTGRVPYLGDAESAAWLAALDRLDDPRARVLVPGHGPISQQAQPALRLTRDYLHDLRRQMRVAVERLMPFDEAFAAADWSAWSHLPAFTAAHRGNAYAVYLEMERESLRAPPG